MSIHFSNPDQLVKLANTATTQIQFTKFANGTGDLRKHLGLVPGQLKLQLLGNDTMTMWRGEATTETVTGMAGFAEAIAKFGPNEAYGQGTFQGLKPGATTEVVSRKHLATNPGARARTKDAFAGSPDLRLRLADIDGYSDGKVATQADLIAHLTEFDPQFATCGWVRSDSSKSHIWTTEGEQVTGEGNFHWAFLATGSDVEFRARYSEWSWYKGYGFYRLSKHSDIRDEDGLVIKQRTPALLERHFMDLAVFDKTRLIFEASAKLEPGLVSRRPAPSFAEGTIVDFTKIPKLTEEQKQIAEINKAKAKAIVKAQREDLVKKDTHERTGLTGVALKAATRKAINDADKGIISEDLLIKLFDGTTIRFGDLNSHHNNMRCESIDEPEAGFENCVVYFEKGVASIRDFHLNKTYRSKKQFAPTPVSELVERINKQFSVPVTESNFSEATVEKLAARLLEAIDNDTPLTGFITGNKAAGKTKFTTANLEQLSEAFKRRGRDLRISTILPLISLTTAYALAAEHLGAKHVAPEDSLSSSVLFRVLCMMSGGRGHLGADVLVIDEIVPSLNQLINSTLPGNKRVELIRTVGEVISTAKVLLTSDADLNDSVVRFLAAMRPEAEVFRVDNRVNNLASKVYRYTGKKGQTNLHAELLRQLENQKEGEIIVFSTDTLNQSNVIGLLVERRGYKALVVNSKTGEGRNAEEKYLIDLVLKADLSTFPEMARLGYNILIHSPSISTGSSFEGETDRVTAVFGDFGGGSYGPTQAAQSLSRVRNNSPRYIWASEYGENSSKFTISKDAREILDEIEDNAKRGLDYLRANVTGEILVEDLDMAQATEGTWTFSICEREIEDYDRTNPWNVLQAEFIAAQNVQMHSFGNEIEALLVVSGCEINRVDTAALSPEELEVLEEQKKIAKKVAKLAEVEALVGAKVLEEGSPELESVLSRAKTGDLDPGERSSLERRLLTRFFAIDAHDDAAVAEIAEADWDKTRKAVLKLEVALNSDPLDAERRALQSLRRSGGQGILENPLARSNALAKLGLVEIVQQVQETPGIRLSAIETDLATTARIHPELLPEILSKHICKDIDNKTDHELTLAVLKAAGLNLRRKGKHDGISTDFTLHLGTKFNDCLIARTLKARCDRRVSQALEAAELDVTTDTDEEFSFEMDF